MATQGRRAFKGAIAAVTPDDVTLSLDGEDPDTVTIPFVEVKKCVLKPVFDFKSKKEEN